MCSKYFWGFATLVTLLAGTVPATAQPGFGGSGAGGLSDSGGLPGLPGETTFIPYGGGGGLTPLPLGNPGNHGFYAFMEGVYMAQTWTLGNQIIAYRGLVDSSGDYTGIPGLYIGSGVPALTTDQFGRRTYLPGLNFGAGYKLEDGPPIYARYMALGREDYNQSATLVPPFFRTRPDQSDTFLVAPVFNFTPKFAGPASKTSLEGTTSPFTNRTINPGTFYGIWNGASTMTITYTQRYSEFELGSRTPMFQTEYSRIYGLAGARFNWFFERFKWMAASYDTAGNTGPTNSATYTNTLSQRLYGPYMGVGNDIYLGNRFALSTDVTGAALLGIVKERAKYELDDQSAGNKRSRNSFILTPSVGGKIDLLWYPLSGVQMRVGYTVNTFWNTRRIVDPVAYDMGAIDPVYGPQVFRMIHGINFGLGLFF